MGADREGAPHGVMSPGSRPIDRAAEQRVLDWLLEGRQPVVRYQTLLGLVGRRERDREVRRARRQIPKVGWAYDQLRRQQPDGFWEPHKPRNIPEWFHFQYFPKFRSTHWRALVLAEFGLDATDPRVKRLAEVIFDYKLRLSSPVNFYYEEVSIAGNTARTLTQFGYADDSRVRKLYDWLLEDQRKDGGWNGEQGAPGTLEAWQALAAFAALPPGKRSSGINQAIARGAEFYLKRNLIKEGRRYGPWFRLHYPTHYFYDVLVGLDVLTRLGYAGDRRLRPALEVLTRKRRPDGTWWMDQLHPDIAPGPYWGDDTKFTPLRIESPGRPSKWITMKALQVLKRVEDAR
jgi:hypothetical protein